MAMVNGERLRAEREDRRRKVARLYLNKITQAEIAEKLGVSQPTICRDLKEIEREWRAEYAADFDARRSRELAELQEMEREAAAAFALKRRDPRYLMARLAIKGRIAKLLGIDAPERKEVEILGDSRVVLLDAILDEAGDESEDDLPARSN